jgi:hypothetical protein
MHGDPDAVAIGLRAHLAASVNQVAIQVLSADVDLLRQVTPVATT